MDRGVSVFKDVFLRRFLVLALVSSGYGAFPAGLEARPLPNELAKKDRAILLTPSADWRLEVAEDRCRLRRSFESEKGPGVVLLEQIAPGQTFDITIAGPDFASARPGSWFYGGMRSDFEMESIDPLEFGIAGYDSALSLGGIAIDDYVFSFEGESKPVSAAIDLDAAEKVERVVLQRSTTIVSFEMGNMKEPIEALNTCMSDIFPKWGLSVSAHQAYNPPRMPNERVYYSRLHHELSSNPANSGHKSLLRVRAIISRGGVVTDCHHEYAFSSGGLEPDVCDDIQAMQFEPATTEKGERIASVYSRSLIMSEFDPWTADSGGGGRWGGF